MASRSRLQVLAQLAIAVVGIGLLTACESANSADRADAARGRALAREYCSSCHNVERYGKSPVADAPRFATLAQRWPLEDLEEALAEGIMVGHEKYPMPVFQLGPEEIADLIAYLKTIQEPASDSPSPVR